MTTNIAPVDVAPILAALLAGERAGHPSIFRDFVEEGVRQFRAAVTGVDASEASSRQPVAEALRAYRRAVAKHPFATDLLGPLYMELASKWGRDRLGQFFTPQVVSDAQAKMAIHDLLANGAKPADRRWRVFEPCVGAGGQLLAIMRFVHRTQGAAGLQDWSLTGVDLDPLCANMWALQAMANVVAHGVAPGEIVALHGNSLMGVETMETIVSLQIQQKQGSVESIQRAA